MNSYFDLKQYGTRFFHRVIACYFAPVAVMAALLLTGAVTAQSQWSIQGRYLTRDTSPAFLSGANYIPSHEWLLILKNWNPSAVDRDMAALHKLGITTEG